MKKLSLNEVSVNKHYWMHNTSYDGRDVWRTVYVIEDAIYPYGPMEFIFLLNGCSERYSLRHFDSKTWKDVYLLEINKPLMEDIEL